MTHGTQKMYYAKEMTRGFNNEAHIYAFHTKEDRDEFCKWNVIDQRQINRIVEIVSRKRAIQELRWGRQGVNVYIVKKSAYIDDSFDILWNQTIIEEMQKEGSFPQGAIGYPVGLS